jgi:uncharacterized protein YebE (UPF0316 family)
LTLYLGLGVFSDVLISAYTLLVGRGFRFPASLISVIVSFLNLLVIVKLFVVTPSMTNIVAYAVGNGLGTFVLMTLSKYLKKWRDKNVKGTPLQRN